MFFGKGLKDFNKASPPQPGTLTKEGIYIGRLKGHDGVEKDWFADKRDARDSKGKRLSLDFDAAKKYTADLRSFGHDDWTVAPGFCDRNGKPDVMGAINNIQAKIPGLNAVAKYPSDWYWTSSPYDSKIMDSPGWVKIQHLNGGGQRYNHKSNVFSVRPVRSLAV